MKKIVVIALFTLLAGVAAAREKSYTVSSPDGTIGITLSLGERFAYEVHVDGRPVVAPTPIAMTLDDGSVWGGPAQPSRIRKGTADTSFATPFYIKERVADRYNWLRADFRQGFALEFRAYDDGVAYRFVSTTDKPLVIASEEAGARFPGDWACWVPYVRDCDGAEIVPFGSQFKTSFENLYTVARLSELDPARLAFLPLVVAADNGVKLCFTEADLQAYPGMYFNYPGQGASLRGVFAPYPKRTHDGGHDNLQNVVVEYADFIAKAAPRASFPWRTVLIAREDRQLLDNDMVMRLAEPSRLEDVSWIRPGLAAWEWWNDWGLYGVGFEAGVNTPTYKHYIDFAARNGVEYLVMDDGWSKDKTDLMSGGSDRLDLEEVLHYAQQKGVGIILWAGYRAFDRDMEAVCRHYSALGVKGFKVDFMDRDDQQIAEFLYRGAATAANSLELGVIRCVDEITEQVRRNTGLSVTDIQIERVLNGQSCSMDPAAKEIIVRQGRLYTEKILSAIMEAGFDLKAIPSVIMGGGASILKRHVTPQDGLCRQIYLTDVHANASGYERIVGQMCAK